MEFFLDFYDFLLMMALIVVSQKSLPFFFFLEIFTLYKITKTFSYDFP